jgi:hypothetical protein
VAPQGWQPPADWPQPPPGWQLWVPVAPAPVPVSAPIPAPAATPAPQSGPTEPAKRVGLFGARKRLDEVEAELRQSREQERRLQDQLQEAGRRYDELRGKDAITVENEIADARRLLARIVAEAESANAANAQRHTNAVNELTTVQQRIGSAQAELHGIRTQIVETQEIALLQEAGIYEYRHRLADSVAYKVSLERLKDSIKISAKNNHAITATTNWTVNNSAVEGQRMVRDFSKLMLRAYNTEADNCVRSMRPHRLESSKDRLDKTRDIISRLGKTMHIKIAAGYHRLRLEELELTADYLAQIEDSIKDVEEREANIRTGWVYVISNVGSFGPDMVKIGLTRRLDPMERVRELGDASVPFRFDVHALIFDADAVSLETRLHQHLAGRRVNRVNLRREFFHVTPAEVLDVLRTLGLQDNLVDYVEEPEAEEWRSSQRISENAVA